MDEKKSGFVMAAPGSQIKRWVCEDCAPSHRSAGWSYVPAAEAGPWLELAIAAGVAPEGATLLEVPAP